MGERRFGVVISTTRPGASAAKHEALKSVDALRSWRTKLPLSGIIVPDSFIWVFRGTATGLGACTWGEPVRFDMFSLDPTPDYYDTNRDQERLRHTSIDDAVCAFLDELEPPSWPQEVTVWPFVRRVIDIESEAQEILFEIVDAWNENFGDPDDFRQLPSDAMRTAALEFVRKVASEFNMWACDCQDTPVTVNTLEWVRANRPGWLSDGDVGRSAAELEADQDGT